MPVTKIVPPGPIAMKRGLVRPAAKTFAVKPAGRVSVRGSANRPLRNCGATSSVTGARAPSAVGNAGPAGDPWEAAAGVATAADVDAMMVAAGAPFGALVVLEVQATRAIAIATTVINAIMFFIVQLTSYRFARPHHSLRIPLSIPVKLHGVAMGSGAW